MSYFIEKTLRILKSTTVRVISFLLFVCFIASFFLYPDFYERQWHKAQGYYYVYQGDRAYKKGQIQETINNYTRALNLYPNHVRARFNLANLYVAYEDYYSAIENYKKALELKPDFMRARIDYAIVLSEATFNYDKAISEYDIAIQNHPKWMYIPFILDNKKSYSYNKGVAYYNKGLAWRGKSLIYGQDKFLSAKYLENAIEAYENALETLKDYDVYYNLGIANQLLKRNYEAGKNYCIAIELEPLNYEAHYNLAILLNSMREYRDSVEEFKKAGLILGIKGEGNKTRYIFDVLHSINQRLAQDPLYKDHLFEDSTTSGKMTYINGKLVVSEEFDNAMMKNFKTCAHKEAFEESKKVDY